MTRRLMRILLLDVVVSAALVGYLFGPGMLPSVRQSAGDACGAITPPGWSTQRTLRWQPGLPSGYVCTPETVDVDGLGGGELRSEVRLGWLPRG